MAGLGRDAGTNSPIRLDTRINTLIAMVGGLHVILLPGLWLLAHMADQVGALGP